jgi:hypothetical protein
MTNLAAGIDVTDPSAGGGAGGENPADLLGWAHRLADSAEAICAAAGSPGARVAIAAALAHIETALENLERGAEEMERLAHASVTRAMVLLGDPWDDAVVVRTARDFEDLSRALANARLACEKVRRNAGPILAELAAA